MAFQHCRHRSNVYLGSQEAQELQKGVQGISSQQNLHDSLPCLGKKINYT